MKREILTFAVMILLVSCVSAISITNLQPSWDASGGGGVFSAYVGPPAYGYVAPGINTNYDGREAGIIKAGLTADPVDGLYWDEGLFGFKPTLTINELAAGTLSYIFINEEGTNPVWMTIEIDTGTEGDRDDNTAYQFVPTSNPISWHTTNAAAGMWQKWNDDMGDVTGNPLISLSQVATENDGLDVVRVYLRLGMGDSYHGTGSGTIAWVDKVTIGSIVYDFIVPTEVYVDDDDSTCGGNAPCFDNFLDAINVVAEGGTINVGAGTYNENIVINKQLILTGAGSTQSIISVSDGIAIDITANMVTVEGLEIKHTVVNDLNDMGIRLSQSDSSTIQNNKIDSNSLGLQLLDSGSNDILNNVFDSNAVGVYLEGTTDGLGHSDVGSNGPFYSLSLNNNIEGNTITNSNSLGGQGGDGIYLDAACEGNTITENTVTYSDAHGYYAWKASDNTITNNIFSNNNYGLHLMGSSDNVVNGNTITSNTEDGLLLRSGALSTTSNMITDNIIFQNKVGINLIDDYSTNNYTGVVTGNIIKRNNISENINEGMRVSDMLPTLSIDARENYWGDCTGPDFEPYNNGIGDSIVNTTAGKVLFDPWMGVCIKNKVGGYCAYVLNDIILSANVTSLMDIENVWFSYTIDGITYTNRTPKVSESNYSVKIFSSQLVGDSGVTWNVYANDSLGRIYSNGEQTFHVANLTSLGVNPLLANGNNGWWITEPAFSFTKDSAGINTFYRWGDTFFTYMNVPFGLANIPNAGNDNVGTIELRWLTSFVCGNETEQSRTFKIDLVNPLIKDLQPANGTTVVGDLKPEISATLTDLYGTNSGINESSIIMEVNGDPVTQYATIAHVNNITSNISFVPTSNLHEGSNGVYISVKDNAGRVSEKTWNFTINSTISIFEMTIYSPQSGIFASRRTPFNISLDGEASRIEYISYNERMPRWRSLCTDCEDYGYFGRQRMKLLNEGENLIGIRATDFVGRTTEQNFSLFIDTRKPVIQKTEPKRNHVTNGSDFYIKYTEENLKEVLLSGNKTLNLTNQCDESGKNIICNIQSDLSSFDGREITYWFDIKDVANNTDSSRPISVLVDTTSPTLTVNSPVENLTGPTVYGKRIPFNIVVSEDVTLSLLDNSSERARWQRLCSNCDSYGLDRLKTKYFTEGNHNLTIKATDKAGNSDSQEIIFEVVL